MINISTPPAGLKFKVGSFTRDTSLASGTQVITGLGFSPKGIIFFANQDGGLEVSFGLDDGITAKNIYQLQTAGFFAFSNPSVIDNSIGDVESTVSGYYYVGKILSLNSDGFTINWAKTGLPTGTLTIYYLALG